MCFSDHLYSLLQIFSYINFNLSIHAPAKGATMGRQCVLYITRISIHAPAKGATSHVVKISLSITYFNPRSREGSDLYNAGLTWRSAKFQSTLPRRERQHLLTFNNADALISIHAPAKGATTYCVTAVKIHSISIHAPAKGATQDKNPLHPQEEKISIHAPAKGATASFDIQ